jgi:NAD(P)-dependent dehydrogenase (short-subunit alcohol dehydrogenase family)
MTGRVALVTGGGTGIGAAITTWLAGHGDSVVIVQPNQEQATTAADHLAAIAGSASVTGIGADLATADGCRAAVEYVLRLHGQVDVLVNNAAITGPPALGPLLDFDDDRLDAIVDVNLKATFRCSRLAAGDMSSRGRGVIVNIASVGAYAAQQYASAYVATKAGVVGLTKGMALELASLGIRVVAVAPGDIDTSGGGAAAAPRPTEWWQRMTPLGRRGTPADVAAVVGFLCSDEAAFITGETVVVDGGWLTY